MSALCLMVAEQSLHLSGIILFLWVLRALLRRIPGSALYLLWILVFTGLLVPFRVEIPYHTEAPAVTSQRHLSPRMQRAITLRQTLRTLQSPRTPQARRPPKSPHTRRQTSCPWPVPYGQRWRQGCC